MAHAPVFRAFARLLTHARRDTPILEGLPLPRPISATRLARWRFGSGTVHGGVGARTHHNAPPRIAVVGGGLAGLNAAYRLQQAGLEAEVYEARTRLGGRIHTVSDAVGAGLLVELGGEFIRADHDDMRALAAEFGLSLFDRVADAARFPYPTTAYVFDGQALREADVARHLRPLARQIAMDAALVDHDFATFGPHFDHLTVADYLDQHADKIGAPFVRSLLESTIRTELGAEAGQTSALHLLVLLPTVDGAAVEVLGHAAELFTVAGGSATLIACLAERLAGHLHTGKELQCLEQRTDGYRLRFADGHAVAADYVIVALPFAVLRTIDLDLTLPSKLQRLIAELGSGANEKVIAGVATKAWRQPSGFAAQAWTGLGFSATWDATQRQCNRADGAITFLLGGHERWETTTGSVRARGRALATRLDRIVPGIAEAATGSVVGTRWHADRFSNGAYVTFTPGQYTHFAEYWWREADDPAARQEVRVGNLLFAGEHLSAKYYGCMNGAAQTGRLAAAVVVRRVAAGAHRAAKGGVAG